MNTAINPLATVDLYIARAASATDVPSLNELRRASLNSIHALHAAGLLSATENAEALNRLVDTCHHRHCELLGVRL